MSTVQRTVTPSVVITPALDAAPVLDILVEAAEWHVQRGLRQWTPALFTEVLRDRIEAQVRGGEVFLARVDGTDAGTLTLTWRDEEVWGADDGLAGYVHRLAVRRAFAGRGIGGAMLDWAAAQCAAVGRPLVRLDTMAGNAELRAYYVRLGFEFRGINPNVGWCPAKYERSVADRSEPTLAPHARARCNPGVREGGLDHV